MSEESSNESRADPMIFQTINVRKEGTVLFAEISSPIDRISFEDLRRYQLRRKLTREARLPDGFQYSGGNKRKSCRPSGEAAH